MDVLTALLFCLAFIGGAFASVMPGWNLVAATSGLGVVIGLLAPALWKTGPKRWVWFVAGLIACLAGFYVQWRTPQLAPNDVSKFAPAAGITVRGKIKAESPTLTRSNRAKFILAANEIQLAPNKTELVSGNLYATLPLPQATGLRPGQTIEVTGTLYKPNAPDHPDEFDFKLYLARQGVFAGLSGRTSTVREDTPTFGTWWITSRMTRAHVSGAGMPEGALLTSLVLGNRAVDLPPDLKDKFIAVGLAGAIAASGFQVSLILGVVLQLSRNTSPLQQFIRGALCLLGFLLLTGLSPSVARAVLMGLGSLGGLVLQRRSRPLVGLALAAVVLLLVQPLWIWDLGFQFSFLATLGLIVTVDPLTKKLEWLPPTIAAAVAVPVAAYIWTLPLQLYMFGKITPYSILANLLTTPLVALTTVGGLIAGVMGVIFVPLGACVSWLMLSPLALIIAIANWIYSLPGVSLNAGTVSLLQTIFAYAAFALVWLHPWWNRRLVPSMILVIVVLFLPGGVIRANLFQATLFAAEQSPVMLIQNQGKIGLINSGDKQTAAFSIVPLLQKAGVNQIDWAIATDPQPDISEGWASILDNPITIKQFRDFGIEAAPKSYQNLTKKLGRTGTDLGSLSLNTLQPLDDKIAVKMLNKSPGVLSLKTDGTTWLLLSDADLKVQRALLEQQKNKAELEAQILWWTGGELSPELLDAVKPKIAIASSNIAVADAIVNQLQAANIRLYWTGRDGAIQWSPDNEIQTLKDREDSKLPI